MLLLGCYGTRGGCLRCCYVVAMVPRVVLGVATQLLRYPGWLLGCCYAVAMVPGVVAKVLLSSC